MIAKDTKLTKDEEARVARLVELDLRTTTRKLDVNDVQRILEHYARQSSDQLFKRASYASDAAVKRMLRQVNVIRQERADAERVLAPASVVDAARAALDSMVDSVDTAELGAVLTAQIQAPAVPDYETGRAVNLVGHADFIREEAAATKPAGMSLRAALKTTVRDRVERYILTETEADDVWNILLWQDAYLSPNRDGGFSVDREADELSHEWIERSRRVRLGSDLIELTKPTFQDDAEPELPPFCEACDDAGERSDHDEPAYADPMAARHGIAARIERTGYPVVGSVAETLLRRELARLAVQGGGSDVDEQQIAISRDLAAVRRASVGGFRTASSSSR